MSKLTPNNYGDFVLAYVLRLPNNEADINIRI
jgi:hypothetical protein